ncbi:hypothetical protein IKF03_02275 [Candidatus Saccharibacteria bacterium]|nr:hypothetical protein [Candidatus Saccharibacteria bacterium]
MNTNGRRYEIVNGPNKDSILDSFKYAFTKNVDIPLTFEIVIRYLMPPSHPSAGTYMPGEIRNAKIHSVAHEDGSGESFNLSGCCESDDEIQGIWEPFRFQAYYHTKTRKGYIIIIDK